jgi:hypothetical protein
LRAVRVYKLPHAGNTSAMSLITILLIVVIVLLLFGGLGYRRRL